MIPTPGSELTDVVVLKLENKSIAAKYPMKIALSLSICKKILLITISLHL